MFAAIPALPLILCGWQATNYVEKIKRWEETVAWAAKNGCADLVEVPSEDLYRVDEEMLTEMLAALLGYPREKLKRQSAHRLGERCCHI